MKHILNKNKQKHEYFEFGFHGDQYLIKIIDQIIYKYSIKYFIETGTNVGSTLTFMAKRHPDIRCVSCEPEAEAYGKALLNSKKLKNVNIKNTVSELFLNENIIRNLDSNESVIFWIDAHGNGYKWPLLQEIELITNYFDDPFILIDDFKVPHLEEFKYDKYNGHVCSYDYIKSSIVGDYFIFYPNYTERTSKHHPLKGWGLLSKRNITLKYLKNGNEI